MNDGETTGLENLVEQAKNGRKDAFEALYQQTYRLVYFHARSITRDDEEALDLVQDTYLAAYRSLGSLQENRNFRKWISRIAFYLGCKKLRKNSEILLGEEEQELFEDVPEWNANRIPEEFLDRTETIKIIKEVIEDLPALQKAAVIAYYMDEMGIADIARAAQCSEGTIKSRLNYARKTMKERILEKEREMGCRIHVVTGPVILLALRQILVETTVSPENMAFAWSLIGSQISSGAAADPVAGNIALQEMGYGSSAAVASAAKGGTAAMVIKAAAIAAAATAVITGGVVTGGYLAHRQIEREDQNIVDATREEAVLDGGELNLGWVEFDEGWKYRTGNGTFLKDQWEEINGELYYFTEDEWLQQEDFRLGNRCFHFSDSGSLAAVSYEDDLAFYTEDGRYYVLEDGVYASDLDGENEWKLWDGSAESLAVDGEWVYFSQYRKMYRIHTDSGQLEQQDEDSWIYVNSMAVSDGKVYMNITDTPPGDGDIPRGGLYEVDPEDWTYKEAPMILPTFPEYEQMQIDGGWLYFIVRNPADQQEDMVYPYVLMRTSLKDYQVEQITHNNTDAFFVCGDTAFCMENGHAVKYSISQQTEEARRMAGQFEENPEGVYQDYLEDVLIPRFGKVEKLKGQFYYNKISLPEMADRIAPAPQEELPTGILRTYIDDLDGDGKKEMSVFRIAEDGNQDSLPDLIFDGFQLVNGQMMNFHTEAIKSISLTRGDSWEDKIVVKHSAGKCIMVFCGTGNVFTLGDGMWDEAVFLIFERGEHGGCRAESTSFFDGASDMDNEQLEETMNSLGFTQRRNIYEDRFYISPQEPDCETILRAAMGMGAAENGLNMISQDTEYQYAAEMDQMENYADHPVYWSIDVDPIQEEPSPVSNQEPASVSSLTDDQKAKLLFKGVLEGLGEDYYYFQIHDINQDGISEMIVAEMGNPTMYIVDQGTAKKVEIWGPYTPDGWSFFDNQKMIVIDKVTGYGVEQTAVYWDGSQWQRENIYWSFTKFGMDIGDSPLEYEGFCDMIKEMKANGNEYWTYESTSEDALSQAYEEYLQEWDGWQQWHQKFHLDDSQGTWEELYQNTQENRETYLK